MAENILSDALSLQADVLELIETYGQLCTITRKGYKDASDGTVYPELTWDAYAVLTPMHARDTPSWNDVGLLAQGNENAQQLTMPADTEIMEGDNLVFASDNYRVTRVNSQNFGQTIVAKIIIIIRQSR